MRVTEKRLKKIRRKISVLICNALVCLSPLGNLIIDLIEKDTKKLGITITLSILGLLFLIYYWYDYKKQKELYEKLKDHFLKEEI